MLKSLWSVLEDILLEILDPLANSSIDYEDCSEKSPAKTQRKGASTLGHIEGLGIGVGRGEKRKWRKGKGVCR